MLTSLRNEVQKEEMDSIRAVIRERKILASVRRLVSFAIVDPDKGVLYQMVGKADSVLLATNQSIKDTMRIESSFTLLSRPSKDGLGK